MSQDLSLRKESPNEYGFDVAMGLAVISSFDLEPEKRKVIEDGADPDLVARAEVEFRRFLALPLLNRRPRLPFTPNKAIDPLWHAFILNTPKYFSFCRRVYGHYLHHLGKSSEERNPDKRSYEYTMEALNQHFREFDAELWSFSEALRCECELTFEKPSDG